MLKAAVLQECNKKPQGDFESVDILHGGEPCASVKDM
jgi:hypothetical protein